MRNLRSVATTMGFSALDGLMMGTRCGARPGAVIYLMQIEKLGLDEVADLLYHQSGLLGVSGVSADLPALWPLESRQDAVGERVRTALALYVRRLAREIASTAAALGGLDALVFTAGIGEHDAELRHRVCEELAWLGIHLDASANQRHGPLISDTASRIAVLVEPTNEEWVAARHCLDVLGPAPLPTLSPQETPEMDRINLYWLLIAALFVFPLAVVGVLKFALRKRGGLGAGWGAALVVLMCWIVALLLIRQQVAS
jgi:acetate kinase